jgi:hypothetical protein
MMVFSTQTPRIATITAIAAENRESVVQQCHRCTSGAALRHYKGNHLQNGQRRAFVKSLGTPQGLG